MIVYIPVVTSGVVGGLPDVITPREEVFVVAVMSIIVYQV